MDQLKKDAHVYEKDGAWWFRSTAFGDEKDRVVIRENGQLTYFATDLAYHKSKFERGYSRAINIWGADHHGYICRIKAALSALGLNADNLDILTVQFATLYRGGEKIQMSTRSGQFITLRELRADTGRDAARFFYVMRKSEQHLDFDLDLAKSRSQDNPVYYIQYAHARICSVQRQLREKGWQFNQESDTDNPDLLTDSHEQALLAKLAAWPETVLSAAINYEPHQISYYLRELANEFHAYYNACQILVDDLKLRNARLSLCFAVRQALRNGLDLLGVSAPETM
jgi:arginyl-tRNA synthetase